MGVIYFEDLNRKYSADLGFIPEDDEKVMI